MSEQPLVGVVMGSKSDYEVMIAAVEILRALQIPHEARVVSAHRTPDLLFEYAETALEREARRICRECWRQRRWFRFWACRWRLRS
jgi:5-(carboxyamino)imidazole ribonucleotide mutase